MSRVPLLDMCSSTTATYAFSVSCSDSILSNLPEGSLRVEFVGCVTRAGPIDDDEDE